MRRLPKILMALSLGATLAAGGALYAQPNSEEAAAVTAPMNKDAKLSPKKMATRSTQVVTSMRAVLARVLRLQQSAREQRDVIKLNCVNDKLLQVKQLLNIAESARNNMIEAIANKDADDTRHQFGQITVAGEKTDGLRDETEACIGEEIKFVGPTQVEVDKPAIIDDPTKDDPFVLDGNAVDIERPAYASPYN